MLSFVNDNENKTIRFRVLHSKEKVIDTKKDHIFDTHIEEKRFDDIKERLDELDFWTNINDKKIKKYNFYEKTHIEPDKETYIDDILEFQYFPKEQMSVELYNKVSIPEEMNIFKYHKEQIIDQKTYSYNSINVIINVYCQHMEHNIIYVEYFKSGKYSFVDDTKENNHISQILDILQNAFS